MSRKLLLGCGVAAGTGMLLLLAAALLVPDRPRQTLATQRAQPAIDARQAERAKAAEAESVKRAEEDRASAELRRKEKADLAAQAPAGRKRLHRDVDKLEQRVWYRDPTSPRYTNQNGFFLYFGEVNGRVGPLRLRVQYTADDWLFVRSFNVYADGRRFAFPNAEFARDHGGGQIWEWYDEPARPEDILMAAAVGESRQATLRLQGQHYEKDRAITRQQKAALKNVLHAYSAILAAASR